MRLAELKNASGEKLMNVCQFSVHEFAAAVYAVPGWNFGKLSLVSRWFKSDNFTFLCELLVVVHRLAAVSPCVH
jgi:hypothetical protein